MSRATDSGATSLELLKTKLFAPRWRDGMVSRPGLVERLDDATQHALTLLSAPPGFGKTTLLAEWLDGQPAKGSSVQWLSLDSGDNDPRMFWTYVCAALQDIEGNLGSRTRTMLREIDSLSFETFLPSLINDLIAFERTIILVLDDLHVIKEPEVFDGLDYLFSHIPPNLRIVIASRSDPPLQLSLMRGRNEITEIRGADLRFNFHETTTFLVELNGYDLDSDDIAALDARTEGWIAGLRLVALSIRGRPNPADFIQTFRGDDRYIVDYLVDEVLANVSSETREFLLRTAILDRLCGPLCDAVTGNDGGQAMLESLEWDNVFVTPLDGRRRWYRYHHLFAAVLRVRASHEAPEEIQAGHLRASIWYNQQHRPAEAIHHAIEGRDLDRAAELIELAWRPMERTRQLNLWSNWAATLPLEQVTKRPVLSLAVAWTKLELGDLETGASWLDRAEQAYSNAFSSDSPGHKTINQYLVDDRDEYEHFQASRAAARAYLAMSENRMVSATRWARESLDQLPMNQSSRRAAPAALLAVAAWTIGDLETAAGSLRGALTSEMVIENPRYVVNSTYILGEILRGLGRFDECHTVYARALRLLDGQVSELAGGAADLHTGLAELHLVCNDLEAVEVELERSRKLGEQSGLPHWQHRWLAVNAGLLESRGDLTGALEALDAAASCYSRGPVPNLQPYAAKQALVYIRCNRLDDAARWSNEAGVSLEDEPEFVREFEHLTHARLLVARHRTGVSARDHALLIQHLENLLEAARKQRRLPSEIEILAVVALAYDAVGDRQRATSTLADALVHAHNIGLARLFLIEGAPMRDLLRAVGDEGTATSFARHLLSAMEHAVESRRRGTGTLVEPLTEREAEVVGLIAAGLRNQEIADELYISVSTVKRHIANAYGKLGVGSRTEAVAKATDLGLL